MQNEPIKNNFNKDLNMKFNKDINLKSKPNNLVKGLGVTGVILFVLLFVFGLVMYQFIVRPAFALMTVTNELKKDSRDLVDAFGSRDLVRLGEVIDETQSDLEKVRRERDAKFGWAKDVKAFKLNEFYSDSDRFINAGNYALAVITEMSKVITPFADAAGLKVDPSQAPPSTEGGLMEAFQTWVSLMPQVANNMDGVIALVQKVGEELEPVNVDKYPKEFRGIRVRENISLAKNVLTQSKDYAPDIKQALTIVPELLGVGSTQDKRYLIIFQNDKEIRPTGGFWTYFATFKLRNGLLQSDFTSYNFYTLDEIINIIDATYDFPDAPKAYAKYLKVERWFARDSNSSPDLPTSLENLSFYYNLAAKLDPATIKPVDGIITIDTTVLRELLEITGPATVNGVTYTSENAVLELEKIASLALAEQANRKRVLGDLMESMLINVFESDKNLWSKIIEKGVDLAARKHITGYSYDINAQKLLEKYNLAGRIWDTVPGDYSMVVQTNLGGDKTNWFVTKQVDHSLDQKDGKWMDTVKITYNYKQPSADFGPFIKRFRDWVRVYAPANSQLISVEGSEDTEVNMQDQERNKVWFSGYLELGPDETKSITFKYYLPDGIIKDDKYLLALQKQSGILEEKHTISINGKLVKELMLSKDTNVSIDL